MKITEYFMRNIPEAGGKAFRRFHLPIIFSIIATFISVYLIYNDNSDPLKNHYMGNMAKSLFAAIPFMSFILLLSEKYNFRQKRKFLIGLAATALVILYYFTLPEKLQITETVRYIILSFFSALTFLSFPALITKEKETTGKIWLFIFLKTSFAEIASLCLFAGLSLAVTAIKMLFFPDWHESYRIIISFAAVSFGLVAPWIILASLPNIEDMPKIEITEKPFLLISRYVLIPAVTFYLLILYLYFGKVIILSKLPEGIISILILSFCGIGIATYIITPAERLKKAKNLTALFIKHFFKSVTGLVILLWYAVFLRIREYGITENRYLLITFSILLTVWTVYFIMSKRKNTVIITVSGAVTAIFISFGPLSIFETSFRSQHYRIIKLLEENHLMVGGKIIKADREIPFETRKKLTSALSYIEERWGLKRIAYVLPQEETFRQPAEPKGRIYTYNNGGTDTEKLMKWMNLKTVNKWETTDNGTTFSLYRKYSDTYTVQGPFHAMTSISCPVYSNEENEKDLKYKAGISKDCKTITVSNINKKYEIDLTEIAQELIHRSKTTTGNLSNEELTYSETSSETKITVVIDNISGSLKENKVENITNMKGEIFFFINR